MRCLTKSCLPSLPQHPKLLPSVPYHVCAVHGKEAMQVVYHTTRDGKLQVRAALLLRTLVDRVTAGCCVRPAMVVPRLSHVKVCVLHLSELAFGWL